MTAALDNPTENELSKETWNVYRIDQGIKNVTCMKMVMLC